MRKNQLAFFVALITIAFCSCHSPRYIYSAAVPNNPYFQEKGDSKIAGFYSAGGKEGLSTGEKNRGYDLQAAYAISNHLAVTASLFNRHELDIYNEKSSNYGYDSLRIDYKRNLFEIGAGYYLPVNNAKTISLNIYAGVGLGKFSFDDSRYLSGAFANKKHYSSNITKWYFQPSLNFMFSHYFRMGLINRFSSVHYSKISTDYIADEEAYYFLDKARNKTLIFVEPSFNMQFGLPQVKWVKFDLGFTTSIGRAGHVYPYSRSFNTFIGASFDFLKFGKDR